MNRKAIYASALTGVIVAGSAVAAPQLAAHPVASTAPAAGQSAATMYACLTTSRTLTRVQLGTAPACASGTTLVSWPVTSGGVTPTPTPTPTTPTPTPTTPTPTPTTPTPTPTTPTPAPTTATPTPTTTGATWSCVTSSFDGGCDFTDPAVLGGNPVGGSSVRNQIWGPVPGETSTMRANGLQDWQDTVNVPAGNTSVTGWPDSQATMTLWSQATGSQPDPLSNYHSMTSTLTIASQDVPGAAYDNGFDVWGGPAGTSNDYAYEMMIWTDQANRGTCGDVTVLAHATFGADTYTLCRNGPAGPASEYIWYHSDAAGNPVNQTTTTVDIYAMVQWMIANGYYPAGYGFDQITVGSEVCSTGGVPETVTLSKWTLAAS